ncbi:hypothetical protein VTO42DRAFT_2426 [Malbranchea cinnamomea]
MSAGNVTRRYHSSGCLAAATAPVAPRTDEPADRPWMRLKEGGNDRAALMTLSVGRTSRPALPRHKDSYIFNHPMAGWTSGYTQGTPYASQATTTDRSVGQGSGGEGVPWSQRELDV